MKDSVAAPKILKALDGRLNGPAGLRVLVLVFLGSAAVFSALPVLRCLRGHTIFDYELWYATGKRVLAGDEIFFFAPEIRFHVSAAMRALSGRRKFARARRAHSQSCDDQLCRLVLQREAERHSQYRKRNHNKLVAISRSKSAGDRLHLVQLPPRSAQSGFARADAVRFCFVAHTTRGCGRRIHCSRCRDQSVSGTRDRLSGLPTLLDGNGHLIPVFLLLILPAPFRGFERAWHDLEKWSAGMLKYSEVTVGQRPMRSYTWKNQSLIGVSNRLLRHVDADAASAPHQPVYVNFADLGFRLVNAIIIGVALALGLLFVTVMPQCDMRTSDTDAIEFALLLLLMLMVTPLSFGYFYSWLLLPFAVVTQQTLARKRVPVLWWTLPALALLALGLAFPRGAQLYGNTFFATLLLFIGLSIELLHFKQQTAYMRSAGELSC